MRDLRRWYYENRDKIWMVILISAFVIFFIKILNNYYQNKELTPSNINTISTKQEINNEITGQLDSTSSIIGGGSKEGETLKKHTKIIDAFINNCNNGRIQEAYDILTDECKETVFPTVEVFKNKYYNNVFTSPKTYSLQNWTGNTYKIMIIDDALATGKVSSNGTHLQDYMTINSYAENGKLNINNYVGRTTKNKVTKTKELEITFIKKETFMDYEEYMIKVNNLTDRQLVLDNGESTKTIYLQDENSIKQYANTGEINYSSLILRPGESKEYTFKFSNSYSKTRVMEYLVFEKVIIDDDTNIEPVKVMIRL